MKCNVRNKVATGKLTSTLTSCFIKRSLKKKTVSVNTVITRNYGL